MQEDKKTEEEEMAKKTAQEQFIADKIAAGFDRKTMTKYVEANWNDMQGLITRGYKSLKAATYLLLKIDENDVPGAKQYFKELVNEDYITTEYSIRTGNIKKNKINGDPDQAVHIAFSSRGLEKLGLDKRVRDTFSREFLEGMSPDKKFGKERATLLGDSKKSKSENWLWGSENKRVDCVIMLYAKDCTGLKKLKMDMYDNKKRGVKMFYEAETLETKEDVEIKEHFGFKDGISQPIIKGFTKSGSFDFEESQLVNAGEFILGHKNVYNKDKREYDKNKKPHYNYSPNPYIPKEAADESGEYKNLSFRRGGVKNLGLNGTYLVFRQMEQHVERFWNYNYTKSREEGHTTAEKAVNLASKIVGRFPNGDPLVKPNKGTCPFSKEQANNFGYAKEDKDGVLCPLGAHIRRTNPRDQVHTGRDAKDSLEMSNTHRMLRRGRIYGEPLLNFDINAIIDHVKHLKQILANEIINEEAIKLADIKRGLHFICLVSDIARQFEFVQNVWANTPTFADLGKEVDPIISTRPTIGSSTICNEFTVPKETLRNRYTGVPEFTTIVGGEYFFMPNIRALRYIIKS